MTAALEVSNEMGLEEVFISSTVVTTPVFDINIECTFSMVGNLVDNIIRSSDLTSV
jgi:hypothetical protein